MSLLDITFGISLTGLLLLSVLGSFKSRSWWQLLIRLLILAVCGGLYYIFFRSGSYVVPKGQKSGDWAFVIILYVCMLLGMASHYLYILLMAPRRKREAFDVGGFFAPIFASPIVFIPLLGAFQNADIDLASLTAPKFMVFFVAFENGFFWKEVVDNRRKELK